MVALPQTFNVADLPDTGGMPLIPEGRYKAVIVESEMKSTKSGSGQYLQLKIVLTEGEHMNTEFIERLNVVNTNQQAVEIAYRTLARISEALGMEKTPQDSNELHNKPLIVEVKTKKGEMYTGNDGVQREGRDRSEVVKYLPLASSQPAAKAPAPTAAQPAQAEQAAAPQQAPWAAS